MNARQAADAIGESNGHEVVESRAGPDLVINDVRHVMDRVEKIAVDRIDTLISRLTSLRQVMILKNRQAVDEVASFVNKVDQGMKDVSHFEELATELEKMTEARG